MRTLTAYFILSVFAMISPQTTVRAQSGSWLDKVFDITPVQKPQNCIAVLRHDIFSLRQNASIVGSPIQIGSKTYARGLGTHAPSHLRLFAEKPLKKFIAEVGVDVSNCCSLASVVFTVKPEGQEAYQSNIMTYRQEPELIEFDLGGCRVVDLMVTDAGDGVNCDHASWGDARIVDEEGEIMWLHEFNICPYHELKAFPFSFIYNGRQSEELLSNWKKDVKKISENKECISRSLIWTDPDSGLKVTWDIKEYPVFHAAEWILHFENTGTDQTGIIENWQDMDIVLNGPDLVHLHHTNGSPSNQTDFEHRIIELAGGSEELFGGGGGRSSNKDFPFFKIETHGRSLIYAVGWSGQWQSRISRHKPTGAVEIKAGLEKTHFRLYPGESVRGCRILVLDYAGEDTWESNSIFRRLLYRHYVSKRDGITPPAIPYSNTCFTRGGGWLNECNARNQISLIDAFAPLGLEAVVTDAGWFEGGWPAGAGNWTVRKDAYPEGIGPVAKAAMDNSMIYGLWFEPERVVPNTEIHQKYPQWCLKSNSVADAHHLLLNFGHEDVQNYFLDIVGDFMKLPGFNVYRQDFNMDPLAYWRANDAPDRQGITEIKYITGLYNYWDKMARKWPGSLRIECSSGGRRIDLETLMRMHIHQKSDYWFHNVTDQASIWGLSQYLPNNTFMAPVNRLDDYTFHSVFPTSICIGWIADSPDFDVDRARKLMDKYLTYRHLLTGAWYPLLPYSRNEHEWIGSQYHRPDLDEGVVLLFRRRDSIYSSIDASLHGLNPEGRYTLKWDLSGKQQTFSGAELMRGINIRLAEQPSSELIYYKGLKSQ